MTSFLAFLSAAGSAMSNPPAKKSSTFISAKVFCFLTCSASSSESSSLSARDLALSDFRFSFSWFRCLIFAAAFRRSSTSFKCFFSNFLVDFFWFPTIVTMYSYWMVGPNNC
ncbi:hypothetical protein BDW71DRAFT_175096 [Aspergillus fruticulosus]